MVCLGRYSVLIATMVSPASPMRARTGGTLIWGIAAAETMLSPRMNMQGHPRRERAGPVRIDVGCRRRKGNTALIQTSVE